MDNEVKEWWEDIQIDWNWRGEHPIHSWQRMRRVLIDLWFPNDYYDILDYTSVGYKSVYSYQKQYVQNKKFSTQSPSFGWFVEDDDTICWFSWSRKF